MLSLELEVLDVMDAPVDGGDILTITALVEGALVVGYYLGLAAAAT